jgi:hypothetical protein
MVSNVFDFWSLSLASRLSSLSRRQEGEGWLHQHARQRDHSVFADLQR